MIHLLKSSLGRLRLLGMLEGISLLVLVFIAVPLKYYSDRPELVRIMGSVHGALFLLFVLNTFSTAIALRWSFRQTTWKVLLACVLPFGTFYVDRKILRPMQS
jgi:integral membrane protein